MIDRIEGRREVKKSVRTDTLPSPRACKRLFTTFSKAFLLYCGTDDRQIEQSLINAENSRHSKRISKQWEVIALEQLTSHIDRRPTTTESRVAYENSTWHAIKYKGTYTPPRRHPSKEAGKKQFFRRLSRQTRDMRLGDSFSIHCGRERAFFF